jgi:uncharacterized membrane protein
LPFIIQSSSKNQFQESSLFAFFVVAFSIPSHNPQSTLLIFITIFAALSRYQQHTEMEINDKRCVAKKKMSQEGKSK